LPTDETTLEEVGRANGRKDKESAKKRKMEVEKDWVDRSARSTRAISTRGKGSEKMKGDPKVRFSGIDGICNVVIMRSVCRG
jgi:hypothetical protein